MFLASHFSFTLSTVIEENTLHGTDEHCRSNWIKLSSTETKIPLRGLPQ